MQGNILNKQRPSHRVLCRSPSKEEFFAVKRMNKRIKNDKQGTINPERVSSPAPSGANISYLRQFISSQGKSKHQDLASTFGSDNCLNFRLKPPKRKRNKMLQPKFSLQQEYSHSFDTDQSDRPFFQETSLAKSDGSLRSSSLGRNRKKTFKMEDFVLLQKVGEGSYSEVFRAIERRTGFVCSLKILSKSKIRRLKVSQNLVRQIKINMFVNHPHIVSLYGYFDDSQFIYLIGQLASDHSLYDAITIGRSNGHKQMPIPVVQNYIGQLCEALHYLHANTILHRDIKPQNMLITFTSTLKLCDFGWSIYNPSRVLRSTLCGTPLYLAPQLVQQDKYDQSVDSWAIGIITFQLLTGSIPFRIKSTRDLSKIVTQQIDFTVIENQHARHFISSLLQKQKEQRKSIEEIFDHPFLQSYLNQKNQ